jgi:hypothetical protein
MSVNALAVITDVYAYLARLVGRGGSAMLFVLMCGSR